MLKRIAKLANGPLYTQNHVWVDLATGNCGVSPFFFPDFDGETLVGTEFVMQVEPGELAREKLSVGIVRMKRKTNKGQRVPENTITECHRHVIAPYQGIVTAYWGGRLGTQLNGYDLPLFRLLLPTEDNLDFVKELMNEEEYLNFLETSHDYSTCRN